ncbi:MAG: glycerol-3-phosphate 1-O-acyltransferase PlsY, partial [Burkholderiaceae bacterium]|nr:glycerol-3-phosphate 1-O-acyltransferase PlsY [Burkholderiaceae bacterium]
MNALAPWLAVLAAYLLGSISFAVVVTRVMGLSDPRSYGSGNPGATNVLRSGSKLAALLTLIGDALKGSLAIWLVRHFGAPFGLGEGTAALAGLAAFVGHLYPVFFRFQGGKGVATFFGAVLVLQPWLGLIACAAWLLVAGLFRYS